MSALIGAATLALAVSLALAGAGGRLPSLSLSSSASTPGGSTAPLDPRIAALAAHHPASQLEAIAQFKPTVSLTRARADALAAGGHVAGTLPIINALAVKMTAEQARTLAASPDIHSVSLNSEITPQGDPWLGGSGPNASQLRTTYDQTLDATGLWRLGATGAGVGVAVIDTGIDGGLPNFRAASGGSRVVETAVTNPNATNASDEYGHGTDVAGIIAGNDGGRYLGVAPDANLISIKASDDQGNATVLDVIYGLQFAIDHQRDYNIRVINLSLNSTTPQSYTTDPLDAAVEAAWMHGIVVVAAAGNRGDASDAVQYAPANDPYVITVGGVDENGSANPLNDTIAAWSSRGVTQDGFQKPDVYAPGAHIVSVLAPNSVFAGACDDCIVDGSYIRTSGTSMAAPMIAGLIADVLSRHPSLTPDQIKGALTSPFVRSNPALQEVDGVRVLAYRNPPEADRNLTPSSLISDLSGDVDSSQSSWSQSSWSIARGALKADFAQSSWSCDSCVQGGVAADPTQSSWSMSSWTTVQDG